MPPTHTHRLLQIKARVQQLFREELRECCLLAQMSGASGLHTGAAPRISAAKDQQKAVPLSAGCRSSIWPWLMARAPSPAFRAWAGGTDNLTKGLLPAWKVFSAVPMLLMASMGFQESPYLPMAPGVQIKCPLERTREDPMPLCLGPCDTRSSLSCPHFLLRPLLVSPGPVGRETGDPFSC